MNIPEKDLKIYNKTLKQFEEDAQRAGLNSVFEMEWEGAEVVNLRKTPVIFIEYGFVTGGEDDPDDLEDLDRLNYCPICREKFKKYEHIYYVYSSLFPRVIIHSSCAFPKAPFDKNGPFAWTAQKLFDLWVDAELYRSWFI